MKIKKLFALLLTAVMAISMLAGCSAKKEDETLEFYFISLMSGGAAWSRAEQGFLDACKEFGINGHYVAPVERNNQVEMANLLDQAITQEADAAIGVFLSTDMFGPSLLKARKQGTVTASVQLTLPEDYIDFQIGTDQRKLAEEMANAIVDMANGEEYTVMFLCGSANETYNMQFTAFEEILASHPNITSLGMRFDESSAATANQVLTDELTVNPDLNAVVCLDSSAATIGAASFVQERGLEDEWLVIGIDAPTS